MPQRTQTMPSLARRVGLIVAALSAVAALSPQISAQVPAGDSKPAVEPVLNPPPSVHSDEPATQPAPVGNPATAPAASPLHADIHVPQSLYTAERPIWIRFSIANCSEEPVDIPIEPGTPDFNGWSLPLERIIGIRDEAVMGSAGANGSLTVNRPAETAPSLMISFRPPDIAEFEAAKEVPPVLPPTAPSSPQTQPARSAPRPALRLGAHAIIGAELDLREIYPPIRYEGVYKLEWRPLGRNGPLATAQIRVEARKDVVLFTDTPTPLTIHLDYEGAPLNVENFLDLVRQGFYSGSLFHRVVAGSVIQGGRPKPDPNNPKADPSPIRPDGKLVPGELRNVPVEAGTVMMVLKGRETNSASCQFFIALTRQPELDGLYTVIGHLSQDSLRTLQQLGDTPVDKQYRPLKPLVIRSMTVVAAEMGMTHQLDSRSRRQALATPASQPAVQKVSERPADRH